MGEWLCCQLWRQPGCYSAMCSRTWKTYFKRLQLSHKDDVDNLKWALLPYFQSCCSFTSQSQQVQTAICQLPREIRKKRRIRCILVWPWSDPGQNTLLPLPLQPPVSLSYLTNSNRNDAPWFHPARHGLGSKGLPTNHPTRQPTQQRHKSWTVLTYLKDQSYVKFGQNDIFSSNALERNTMRTERLAVVTGPWKMLHHGNCNSSIETQFFDKGWL